MIVFCQAICDGVMGMKLADSDAGGGEEWMIGQRETETRD